VRQLGRVRIGAADLPLLRNRGRTCGRNLASSPRPLRWNRYRPPLAVKKSRYNSLEPAGRHDRSPGREPRSIRRQIFACWRVGTFAALSGRECTRFPLLHRDPRFPGAYDARRSDFCAATTFVGGTFRSPQATIAVPPRGWPPAGALWCPSLADRRRSFLPCRSPRPWESR